MTPMTIAPIKTPAPCPARPWRHANPGGDGVQLHSQAALAWADRKRVNRMPVIELKTLEITGEKFDAC